MVSALRGCCADAAVGWRCGGGGRSPRSRALPRRSLRLATPAAGTTSQRAGSRSHARSRPALVVESTAVGKERSSTPASSSGGARDSLEQLTSLSSVDLATDEGTSSFTQALFNSVNILMGVGLLSVPYALKEGGWAALGVLGLLGLTTNYTGKLIVKCQESVCDDGCVRPYEALPAGRDGGLPSSADATSGAACQPVATYEGIGELAFGEWGRRFITVVLYTELLGTCGLFFILEGDHLALLLGDATGLDSNQLMLLSSLLIVPTTWLADLSALSYVGILGGASALTLAGVITNEFLHRSGILDPHVELAATRLADTSILHASHLPVTFGLLAFVFAGHAVFPGIYTSMKEKERFPEMLDTTYLIVGATCIVIGVSGYFLYGDKTMEEVTMNLDNSGIAADLATALILISPFTKFALTLDPVARGVEQKLQIDVGGEGALTARLLRTGLGVGTLGMAVALPFFAALMALIGSFLTLVVSVIFPSLCYLTIYEGRVTEQERALNYFVVALGVFCAAAGTWTAFQEIFASM